MGAGVSKGSRPSTASSRSRPPTASSTGKDNTTPLGVLLSGAGIKKVLMIRHANAKPRDLEAAAVEAGETASVLKPDTPFANAWTVGDLRRDLTDKGQEQAAAASSWLAAHSLRAVICSEAVRATATKDIMTKGAFPKDGPACLTLHTLHPSRSGTPDCEKMFDKLGYGTLATYFADQTVEGCEGKGREVFRHYITKVSGELHALISAGMANFPPGGDTVAVFGHAVFLNAVAVAVGEAMEIAQAEDLVAVLELGEAQGILCDADAQSVSLSQVNVKS